MRTGYGHRFREIVILLGLIAVVHCAVSLTGLQTHEWVPLASVVEVAFTFPKSMEFQDSASDQVLTYLKNHAAKMQITFLDTQLTSSTRHAMLTLKSGIHFSSHHTPVSFLKSPNLNNGNQASRVALSLQELSHLVQTLSQATYLSSTARPQTQQEGAASCYPPSPTSKPTLVVCTGLHLTADTLTLLQRLVETAVRHHPTLQLSVVSLPSVDDHPATLRVHVCAFGRCRSVHTAAVGPREHLTSTAAIQRSVEKTLRRVLHCGGQFGDRHTSDRPLPDDNQPEVQLDYEFGQPDARSRRERDMFLGPSSALTFAWVPHTQEAQMSELTTQYRKYSKDLGCLVVCSPSTTNTLRRLFPRHCRNLQTLYESENRGANGGGEGVAVTSVYKNDNPGPTSYKHILTRDRFVADVKEAVIDAQHGVGPRHYFESTSSPVFVDSSEGLRQVLGSVHPTIVFILRLPDKIRFEHTSISPKIEIYRALSQLKYEPDNLRYVVCILETSDLTKLQAGAIHVVKSSDTISGREEKLTELESSFFDPTTVVSKYSMKILRKGLKHLKMVDLLGLLTVYSSTQDWLADL